MDARSEFQELVGRFIKTKDEPTVVVVTSIVDQLVLKHEKLVIGGMSSEGAFEVLASEFAAHQIYS